MKNEEEAARKKMGVLVLIRVLKKLDLFSSCTPS